jgi:conjugative transfer signal peptidase TraF
MSRRRKRTAELPLFSRARAPKPASRSWQTVSRCIAALAVLGLGLALTIAFAPRPFFVWNASASAPVGLYRVGSRDDLRTGDMVIARLPKRYRLFAAQRHYLPINVPLVKRVAAVPGDNICAYGHLLFVNGKRAAVRRTRDRAGRKLRWWNGCLTLRHGAHLLLMDHPESFDGRYFGPTARDDIIGEAWPLWTR